jgi:hypothetical protein
MGLKILGFEKNKYTCQSKESGKAKAYQRYKQIAQKILHPI